MAWNYAWELARLYPPQGAWTEQEYLRLTDGDNIRVEFRRWSLGVSGNAYRDSRGTVGVSVRCASSIRQGARIGEGPIQRDEGANHLGQSGGCPTSSTWAERTSGKRHNQLWDGIDLAMEVVGDDPKDRKRDYEEKLAEYARAGIAEYWIVDYQERVVIVNTLPTGNDEYREHCRFTDGDLATSVLLEGFTVDVGCAVQSC